MFMLLTLYTQRWKNNRTTTKVQSSISKLKKSNKFFLLLSNINSDVNINTNRLLVKREIAKSRPELLPRPRARRAFFFWFSSKLEIDEAFQISHKLGLGLAAKFSKAFAIQLDCFRGQYTPRPSAHPPKNPGLVCFPGFHALLAAHVFKIWWGERSPHPLSPAPPSSPPSSPSSPLIWYFPHSQSETISRDSIYKCLWGPGIAKEWISPAYVARAGIFKESMGARNRGGIHSLESIPGLHKHFKIRVLAIHRLAEFIP